MNAWIRTLEHAHDDRVAGSVHVDMWTLCTYIDSNAIKRVFDAIKKDSDCVS